MFDALQTLDDGSQLAHPVLKKIYSYWAQRCAGRWAPSRADIDPADLGPLLPYIALVEPLDGGRDYRLRLMGEHILQGYRFAPVPRLLSDIKDQTVTDLMRAQYERLARERKALRFGPEFSRMPEREHVVTEHIDLPLSSDGLEIDMILAGAVLLSERDWTDQAGASPVA
ncbi:PAS domain-containing protein [Algihabitans albus]|uniref:PAS domain-containing protein n=1 Tax=Algihabitans albus TaxID=2164067 RepID=UPI000E5C69A8|nr:PAS domain-containing protein [Algihabitans albus]